MTSLEVPRELIQQRFAKLRASTSTTANVARVAVIADAVRRLVEASSPMCRYIERLCPDSCSRSRLNVKARTSEVWQLLGVGEVCRVQHGSGAAAEGREPAA